jgi:hypothetical protein
MRIFVKAIEAQNSLSFFLRAGGMMSNVNLSSPSAKPSALNPLAI